MSRILHRVPKDTLGWADSIVDGKLVSLYRGTSTDKAAFAMAEATAATGLLINEAKKNKTALEDCDFIISVDLVPRRKDPPPPAAK